ncbi:MAG: aldehyde dehydrogenase (NADP(+)) [Acidocella sp. 20-57-95]|nr:MAG: aldehyde dehydrogenase (NADP(+)) [Acidocella sp. 20-57-95]
MDAMTDLTGQLLIGAQRQAGSAKNFQAVNPATGATLDPAFDGAGPGEIEAACALAAAAYGPYRATTPAARAEFLEAIAKNIEAIGEKLIERAMQETGLPKARLEGERARTAGQLRLFAAVVREGSWMGLRVDPAMPERKPLPRPDLRLRKIPLGPVAVFGASNFPLAFSVAGGDTASALAAGCPVVMKGHPAHPGTCELVGRAIQAAVAECKMPDGVFSLLSGIGNELGMALVRDHRIKAVGFTGSRGGGLALAAEAAKRPEPIPVYAEMSSVNPVLLMPAALAARGAEIGKAFIASLAMGAGQFCTNPGIILVQRGPGLEAFVQQATDTLAGTPTATMLHPGIFKAYQSGVQRLHDNGGVKLLARSSDGKGPNECQGALFLTDAQHFMADKTLSEEVFGASSLIVTCADLPEMQSVLETLEGQLTITLQMDEGDNAQIETLLPLLEQKAGRILVNGWPTGVEVSHAMVHGGPFPSTSDSRTTSVGTLAIERFLRPVCYQNFAQALLPEELRDSRLGQSWRRVDGRMTAPD